MVFILCDFNLSFLFTYIHGHPCQPAYDHCMQSLIYRFPCGLELDNHPSLNLCVNNMGRC